LWRIGDTYNVSIGQGDTLVTPLQVAAYTVVFANGGTLYRPYILDIVVNPETKKNIQQTAPTILRKGFVRDETLLVVREGMRMVVTTGTARILQAVPVAIAGKTGTAETGIKNQEHAWFTGFAPYENPELVITVLVEHGGEGSLISAPIAKEILEWYFTRHPLDSERNQSGDK
jgi:penicillin-binding protein 2